MHHGMLTVYKEAGYTSSDAVARLRGILRMRKIGHTGTLDPDAVGVLPMCLGNATRICELIFRRRIFQPFSCTTAACRKRKRRRSKESKRSK